LSTFTDLPEERLKGLDAYPANVRNYLTRRNIGARQYERIFCEPGRGTSVFMARWDSP
jgi:hypothetical protein